MSKNTIPAALRMMQSLQQCAICSLKKKLTPLMEALRGFELFIIRLGKDTESVLLGINEHVTTLRKIGSGYFSSTSSPRGKKRKVEDYASDERVPRNR
jgi:hypothetical protein